MKSYLRDKLGFTMIYWAAIGCMILFYQIDLGERVEVIYPLMLAVFFYTLDWTIGYVYYQQRWNKITDLSFNPDCVWDSLYQLDNHTKRVVLKAHHDYLEKLANSEEEKKKEVRFLSMWIHNMKTPVTVNDLLWQRMHSGELSVNEAIEEMKGQNDELYRQLDLVLEMVRLREFSKDYVPEPVDLVKEVKELINDQKKLFIYHHVFPKITTDIQELIVLSDRRWNRCLMQQILSNAIKYSEHSANKKEVEFQFLREGTRGSLVIMDHGIGIPSQDLKRVFEPFFTGENGRKGYSSSGIGLYFCKEVAKELGIEITLTSKEGEGTCVTLTYLAKL